MAASHENGEIVEI